MNSMNPALDLSLGLLKSCALALEIKPSFSEIFVRALSALSEDWFLISRRSVDLSGPLMNSNWPPEEMTINFSYGTCIRITPLESIVTIPRLLKLLLGRLINMDYSLAVVGLLIER